MDFHTSLAGSDLNDGLTPGSAFETVQKGVGAQPLQVGVGGKRAFPPGAEDLAPTDD